MTTLWLIDPTGLTKPANGRRKIGRKPLIDLAGLQQAIRTGALDENDVELATRSSSQDLQALEWEVDDLLKCLCCATDSDFKGAEWCEDGNGHSYPCDAYSVPYDNVRRCRDPHGWVEYYLKFSIDEAGSVTLVMIRNHLSR